MTSSLPPFRPVVDPPPPRRGARTGLIIGVVVAVVLLCGFPVFGFVAWMFAGPDRDEPRAAAVAYLEHLEAGDDAAAYRSVCASTRAEVTLAEFTATVEAAPRPAAHEITRVAFLDEPGNSAAVGVRATDRAGSARELTLYLDSEGGPYQVCGTDLI